MVIIGHISRLANSYHMAVYCFINFGKEQHQEMSVCEANWSDQINFYY